MKVVILGAGKAGRFLYDEISQKASEIEVLGFGDNFLQGEYDGKIICKPMVLLEQNAEQIDAVFIAAGAQKTVRLLVDMAVSYDMDNIYMLHDIAGKCRLSPFTDEGQMIPQRLRKIKFSKEKPTLPYFEVPITDKCNLNCKGCLFACNAIKNNEHVEYEQLEKDARRMAELFCDIPWIRILGGEPLMHPRIMDVLRLYREVFPESEIDLCTNGLLIPKMPQEFWECLKAERITVHVSGYKPTYHMLDEIDRILRSNGLEYTVLKRETFLKYYTMEPDNAMEENYINCIASSCREVYRGRLLKCSAVIAFEKFNEQFGTQYQTKEKEDWFNLYDAGMDAWKMKEILDHGSGICKYCDVEHMQEFEWDYAGSDASVTDYILD